MPKMFIVWPFIERVYQLLINDRLPSLSDGEAEGGGESGKLECELHPSDCCLVWIGSALPTSFYEKLKIWILCEIFLFYWLRILFQCHRPSLQNPLYEFRLDLALRICELRSFFLILVILFFHSRGYIVFFFLKNKSAMLLFIVSLLFVCIFKLFEYGCFIVCTW